MDGVKLVSEALLGKGEASVLIGGKTYTIPPPTIERIAGAGIYLSCLKGCSTFMDMIETMGEMEAVCKALSWFIQGDEHIYKNLMKGTLSEVTEAMALVLSLIGIENFPKLSALVKNVQSLIAITR